MSAEEKRDKQFEPDREYFRDYLVGCSVILLAFLIGVAIIAYFWMRSGGPTPVP